MLVVSHFVVEDKHKIDVRLKRPKTVLRAASRDKRDFAVQCLRIVFNFCLLKSVFDSLDDLVSYLEVFLREQQRVVFVSDHGLCSSKHSLSLSGLKAIKTIVHVSFPN